MEGEMEAEIHDFGTASLHLDEREQVLNTKDEIAKKYCSENVADLTSQLDEVDAPGQIVPTEESKTNFYQSWETEESRNVGHSGVFIVPQASLEPTGHVVSNESAVDEKGCTPSSTSSWSISCESNKQAGDFGKTFVWPAIGFRDQLAKQSLPNGQTSNLDLFLQVLQCTDERNEENNSTEGKQDPLTTFVSSDLVDQSEKASTPHENKISTSILKKDRKQEKKTVHFPENVASVKFYDISDDDDSDNDTVVLSDPEEDDDLQDQEVPYNTYDDYTNYHRSSFTTNFIPHFSFPPVLAVSNLYVCDEDDDEQIRAIMNDGDERESYDPTAYEDDDILLHEQSTEKFKSEQLTSTEKSAVPEILNSEPIPDHLNLDDSIIPAEEERSLVNLGMGEVEGFVAGRDDQPSSTEAKEAPGIFSAETNMGASRSEVCMVSCEAVNHQLTTLKEPSRKPDDEMEKMEVEQIKYGIRGIIEDDFKDNSVGSTDEIMETDGLVMEQSVSSEVKSLVGNGLELDHDEHMNSKCLIEDITSTGESVNRGIDSSVTTENSMMASVSNDADSKDPPSVMYTLLDAWKKTREISAISSDDTKECHLAGERLVKKVTSTSTREKREEETVSETQESSRNMENDSMDTTPSSSSLRAFYRTCGSRLMGHRARIINNMILNEDVQVNPIAIEEYVFQQHSFTKEEITFPNTDIADVPSLESNILASGRRNKVLTKPWRQEFKPTKYVIHSLISSDHFVEFKEASVIEQKKDIPMKIKPESHRLQDDRLKQEFDGNVKKHEREFDYEDETSFILPSISRDYPGGHSPKSTGISQVVPGRHPQKPTWTRPIRNASHTVPSPADLIMDTSEISLHDLPSETFKPIELKLLEDTNGCKHQSECSTRTANRMGENDTKLDQSPRSPPYSRTHHVAKQGQGARKLRVGLSKSTRVKSLHPYIAGRKIE